MDNVRPIKRNPALVELSRDHHFALLLLWKIREGLKKQVQPDRIGSYVIHFFDTDLRPHFNAEEELLFNRLPANQELRIQAEDEHRRLHGLIDTLRSNPGNPDALKRFSETLESHIRFEERTLFNYLQENIPEVELSGIAASLNQRAPVSAAPWPDIFWDKKSS